MANVSLLGNWAINRFSCCWVHLDKKNQGGSGHFSGRNWTLGEDLDSVHNSISSPNYLSESSPEHEIHYRNK